MTSVWWPYYRFLTDSGPARTHGLPTTDCEAGPRSRLRFFRHPTAEGARSLFEQGRKNAQGAAMMANCELDVHMRAVVWPVRLNQTMAEVTQRKIEAIGMPHWTADEQDFAKALQTGANVSGS